MTPTRLPKSDYVRSRRTRNRGIERSLLRTITLAMLRR